MLISTNLKHICLFYSQRNVSIILEAKDKKYLLQTSQPDCHVRTCSYLKAAESFMMVVICLCCLAPTALKKLFCGLDHCWQC